MDGYLNPKMIIKIAQKRGLSGVAITDHNTIKGALNAKKFETKDFQVIVGSEIETNRGEVIGLFLNQDIKSKIFQDVIQEINDQNGLVIIPHPFDKIRRNGINPLKDDTPMIDFVEVYNSRCLLEKYNIKALEFTIKNKLKISAGSDAHFANEIGNAGVFLDQKIENPEDLLENDITYFGEKSRFINLGLTEMLKIWRQTVSRF
jgi:predicted metal-dependent phosphoesterase TrpH